MAKGRDLTGCRFGRLMAVEPLEKRTSQGGIVWRCRCDCGAECDCSQSNLMHGNVRSCGCLRRERGAALSGSLHRTEGTCVELLGTRKRRDNTSGVTGVYAARNGRWRAAIIFRKTRYELGQFSTLEEAQAARLRGKEMHEDFLTWYAGAYPQEYKRILEKRKDVRKGSFNEKEIDCPADDADRGHLPAACRRAGKNADA